MQSALANGSTAMASPYVTSPGATSERMPPPFASPMSAPSSVRNASATRSPRFVSRVRTAQVKPSSSYARSFTSERATTASSVLPSSSSMFWMKAAVSSSCLTGGFTSSAEIVSLTGSMTIFPQVCSCVPVCASITSSLSLFVMRFSYCSWEWPSMTTSMPEVCAITALARHGAATPVSPRCASATT